MLSKENKFQLSTQADQISTQGIGLLLFSRTVRDCAHAINGWLYGCDDVGVEKNRTEKSIRYLIRYKPQEKWEIWLVCPLLGQNKILYRTLHFTGKAKEWLKLVDRLSVKVAPCCKTWICVCLMPSVFTSTAQAFAERYHTPGFKDSKQV